MINDHNCFNLLLFKNSNCIFLILYCFSICRGSPDYKNSTQVFSPVFANWMDSQKWNSHNNIQGTIHGKSRGKQIWFDCQLSETINKTANKIFDHWIVMFPPGKWLKWLEWGWCDSFQTWQWRLVWQGGPVEPSPEHPIHGEGVQHEHWGVQPVFRCATFYYTRKR